MDQEGLVHGPQTGLWWTESTLHLSGTVLVHQVYSRVAGEGAVPLFFPRRCSCRRRAHCEPPVAALVSDWGGEKLPQTMVITLEGSRWRLGFPRALATANSGLLWQCLSASHGQGNVVAGSLLGGVR